MALTNTIFPICVQNAAANNIFLSYYFNHITPLLALLQRLGFPFPYHIKHKLVFVFYVKDLNPFPTLPVTFLAVDSQIWLLLNISIHCPLAKNWKHVLLGFLLPYHTLMGRISYGHSQNYLINSFQNPPYNSPSVCNLLVNDLAMTGYGCAD